MQIIINTILTASIFILISFSLALSYSATKFFNLSQAAIISFGAYFTYLFFIELSLPLSISIPISIICALTINLICEICVYGLMRSRNSSPFILLIASIGLYSVLQNIISLFFGDDTKSLRTGEVKVGHFILGAYITDIQIITITASSALFLAMLLLLHKTLLGKQIRAVSSNPNLSEIYGISSKKIILWVTAISAALAATAGILIALDVDMTPTFGFHYFLYGAVAMILGGVGNYRGVIFGSLLLASAQHLAAFYIATQWMDAVAYIILILFLIWKPLGLSGQRLKKVEV
jgi:branched-chain amino acid transport system permease protein